TRQVATGTSQDTGPSIGNSGDINFEAKNPDPFNPFFNIEFNHPRIIVEAGAKLLAHSRNQSSDPTTFKPGDVTLEANNINWTFNYLIFNDFGLISRDAEVAVDGATIKGGNVTLASKAGDVNLADELSKTLDGHGQIFSGVIQSVLGPLDDLLSSP